MVSPNLTHTESYSLLAGGFEDSSRGTFPILARDPSFQESSRSPGKPAVLETEAWWKIIRTRSQHFQIFAFWPQFFCPFGHLVPPKLWAFRPNFGAPKFVSPRRPFLRSEARVPQRAGVPGVQPGGPDFGAQSWRAWGREIWGVDGKWASIG